MSNMNNFDLQSFIAGAERNARSSVLPPGYFAKQTYLQTGDVFNATYGRRVWDSLNNQTRFWNIIRKVQFGPTTGWRLRTDRGGGRSGPVTEPINSMSAPSGAQTLPEIDNSNYVRIDSNPRIIASDFGVTLLGQVMAGLEGGMGDNLAVEQEASARDHIKELNQELLLRGYGKATSNESGTAGTITLDSNASNSFRRGDIVRVTTDSDGSSLRTVVGTSGNTLTLNTIATASDQADADGVIYVNRRGGFTSLDDVVHHDGLTLGGVANVNVKAYNMYDQSMDTVTRAAGTWSAGQVMHASGVGRDFTLAMMQEGIRRVREAGGDPDMILMGYDQYDKLNALLQVNQRFLGWDEFQVKSGDDMTLPGTHAGFQTATFQGIPIFVDIDVPKGIAADGTDLGSNVYFMDTRYLEIAIAAPTQYIDNRDFFQANTFVLRGLFYTMGEFRSYRFDTNVKLTDLNA